MPQIAQGESVFLPFIGFGFFCDGSAMLERAPDTQEVPTRVCNGCGAQMKHLTETIAVLERILSNEYFSAMAAVVSFQNADSLPRSVIH
jgi:hypothetical protein